jgi:hypothetical protein
VEAARERIKTRYNVLKEQNLEEQPQSKATEQANKTDDDQARSYYFRARPFHSQWGAGQEGIRVPSALSKQKQWRSSG